MMHDSHTGHREPPAALMRRVDWAKDLDTVRLLFEEYRRWLVDHQDTSPAAKERVASGLALIEALSYGLPGAYGPPRGDVLLWFKDQTVVACGALRELEPGVGEIKRISVSPDFRGKEFGRPFVTALIARARELGYDRLRVDTLPSMSAAIEFYQEAGFRPCAAFWSHPVSGALFFERHLSD